MNEAASRLFLHGQAERTSHGNPPYPARPQGRQMVCRSHRAFRRDGPRGGRVRKRRPQGRTAQGIRAGGLACGRDWPDYIPVEAERVMAEPVKPTDTEATKTFRQSPEERGRLSEAGRKWREENAEAIKSI